MDLHCNHIVSRYGEKGESPQFSISLPLEAIEIIEKRLKPYGLYGKKRATICLDPGAASAAGSAYRCQ
jgi:hypothetical protein